MEMFKSIALRFLRVFVAAGIAQALVVLAATPLSSFDPDSLKNWLGILITSFLSGGLAGLDKALRYEEK